MKTIVSIVIAGLLTVSLAVAGDSRGGHAGIGILKNCCKCGAETNCKIVQETKKVKKTVWVVECEEFCPLLPGPKCGCECGEKDCGGCQAKSCDPCDVLKRKITPPVGGKVRTRKKLVRKEIVCEVPVFRCVPVCCKGCDEPMSEEPALKVAPTPRQAVHSVPLPPQLSEVRYQD